MLKRPITTGRLLIRPFVADDWPAVYAYMSAPGVATYLPQGQLTEAQARAYTLKNAGDQAEVVALLSKDDDRVIGHLDFHPWFAPQTYEIGWALHPKYHGYGYATEAARALLHYSFAELQLHRVIATCQPENVPSYRVMEKIGMRREGHFRQCIYRGPDHWWDEYFYAILADEWFYIAQLASLAPHEL
jgi:RimJ/RimL family protein N-acetyltransferase